MHHRVGQAIAFDPERIALGLDLPECLLQILGVRARVLARRLVLPGTPLEVANVAVFLASDAASYVTGQAISVSGGLTMC